MNAELALSLVNEMLDYTAKTDAKKAQACEEIKTMFWLDAICNFNDHTFDWSQYNGEETGKAVLSYAMSKIPCFHDFVVNTQKNA